MADNNNTSSFFSSLGSSVLQGALSAFGGLPGSLLGSGLSSLFQGNQMKKQVKYQKQLMDYQASLNKSLQQWQWNNQYGAQVQGMRGAGLNPALMQGGSFGLNSAPSVNGGSSSPLPVSIPSLAENALLASQKANIDADTRLKEKQANLNSTQTKLLEATLPSVMQQNSPEWLNMNTEQRKVEIDNLRKQGDLTDKQVEQLDHAINLIDSQVDLTKQQKANLQVAIVQMAANIKKTLAEADEVSSRIAVNYAQVAALRSQAALNGELAKSESFKRALMSAETELKKAQTELTKAQTETEGSKKANIDADTKKKEAEEIGQQISNGLNELILEAYGDMPEGGKNMKKAELLVRLLPLLMISK